MPCSRLAYVSGTGGVEVQLDARGSALSGTAASVRGGAWSYSLTRRGISGVSRDAAEATLEVAFLDEAAADLFRRVSVRDVSEGTPGTLVARGEWEMRAYAVSVQPSAISPGWHVDQVKLVLLDGYWHRAHRLEFTPAPSSGGDGALDLPYGAPYDLMPPPPRRYVEASEWARSPVGFTIYGPVSSPSVEIGGNAYKVDVDVPSGSRVEVDPIARTAVLIGPDGSRENVFSRALRGEGSYIFERLPPGVSEVVWDESFGFDLTWHEEEGGVPWT